MLIFIRIIIILSIIKAFLSAQDLNYRPVVTTPWFYETSEFNPRENFTFQYNLYDPDGDYLTVLLQLSYNSGETWFTPHNVSGIIGHKIRSQIVPPLYYDEGVDSITTDFYELTWNIPNERWWSINFDNLQWRIVADDHFEKPDLFEWVTVPVDHEEIHGAIHDEQKFHIMKYEVTNAQYIDFLNTAFEAGLLSITNDWLGYYIIDETVPQKDAFCYVNQVVGEGNWESIQWNGEHFYVNQETEDFPVLFVTHKGAQAFADFYGWQLPTSEQWYRAALGYLERPFPWGDFVEYQQANFWNSQDPYDNGPTPVGFFDGRYQQGFKSWDSPSWYGCYDMVGNVREWLRDTTVAGGSWYTINPQDIATQSPSTLFDMYGTDFQTGFRCISEFFGR